MEPVDAAVKEAIETQLLGGQLSEPMPAGKLFRHTDGGIYRYVGLAQHADDQSVLVLYRHVWPFEESTVPWARNAGEFIERFKPIIEADLAVAMKEDRAEAQQAVRDAKAARRRAAARTELFASHLTRENA